VEQVKQRGFTMQFTTLTTLSNRSTLALLLGLVAGLLHTSPAEARGFRGLGRALQVARIAGVGARTYGRQSSGGYILRPEELKTCLVMESKLEPIDNRLQQGRSRIDREDAALKSLSSELDRTDHTVDSTSSYQVSQFNKKVSDYNTRIAQLKIAIEKWNAQLSAAQAEFQRVDNQCGGRWYYESDKLLALASIAK
jgi:Skp family chaperone for outer membrane proteins